MAGDPKTPQDEQPDDLEAFSEGMGLLRANHLEEAMEKFRHASVTGKDRPMEHYALAVALYRMGSLSEAKVEFERFVSMSPQDTRYLRQARAILPILEQRMASEKPVGDPLSQSEPYEKGIQALLRGNYQEAAESFEAALEGFPGNRCVHNNLGLAHLALRDYQQAISEFGKALAIEPAFPEALNNLGLAWSDLGTVRARESFEAALQVNPDFFDALLNLGALYYRQGDLAKALELWEKAERISPDDSQVRRNLESVR